MPSPSPGFSCAVITGTDVNIELKYSKPLEYATIGLSYTYGPWFLESYVISNSTQGYILDFTIETTCPITFGVSWQRIFGATCLADTCSFGCSQRCNTGSISGKYFPNYPDETDERPLNFGFSSITGPACFENLPQYLIPEFYWKPNMNFLMPNAYRTAPAGSVIRIQLKAASCFPYIDIGKNKAHLLVWSYNGTPFPTMTPPPSPEPTFTPFPTLPTTTPYYCTPLPTPEENGKSLWVWGQNYSGQLGRGDFINKSSIVQNNVNGAFWKSVSVGFDHMAGILTNNQLYSWGSAAYGKLGNSLENNPFITSVGCDMWDKVFCGYQNTAGIQPDGSLWIWGSNYYGQAGNESSELVFLTPVQVLSGVNNWKTVAIGGGHIAAIKNDGSLWLWGANTEGQLGISSIVDMSSPVQSVYSGNYWEKVACGLNYTLAMKNDGTIWAWGGNYGGCLGLGSDLLSCSVPTQITNVLGNWIDINAGLNFAGAINSSNIYVTPTPTPAANMNLLYTWGQNNFGQIGNNTAPVNFTGENNASLPVLISAGNSNWTDVYQGWQIVSAVKADGTLWSWGRNAEGQLAINSVINKSTPVQELTLSTNWISTSCLGEYAGGIKSDGSLWLWGSNYASVLCQNIAYPTLLGCSSPVQIYGGGTWKKIRLGVGYFGGGMKPDNTLWFWGGNYFGGCGANTDNTSFVRYSSPVQEITMSNWLDFAMGYSFVAAIKNDGSLWLWGYNYAGQLGDGTLVNRSSPIQEVTNGTWKAVSAGLNYTLAIKSDNTLWSWGANYYGNLGQNNVLNLKTPTQIGSENTWQYIATGDVNSLAIKTDGSLWSWGNNSDGDLAQNNTIDYSSPVQITAYGNDWVWVGGKSAGIRSVPFPTNTPTPTPT